MSDLKVLSVQKRAGLGKGANRRARQEELIPGVFYTAKGENLPVQMSRRVLFRSKPVKITVPVEFTGVARGTKVGGKLETYREQIQLMAKPLDMPAKVTIDISGMDVGTTIQIADVKLPEGVKAAYDNNYAIVSVLMPGGDDAAAE